MWNYVHWELVEPAVNIRSFEGSHGKLLLFDYISVPVFNRQINILFLDEWSLTRCE
jgi:hypothetical protein